MGFDHFSLRTSSFRTLLSFVCNTKGLMRTFLRRGAIRPRTSYVRFFSEEAEVVKRDQEQIWRFLASFNQEQHYDKFDSWASLQRTKKHHLVDAGIDKPKDRKLILRKIEGWKQEQRYKLNLLQEAGRAEKIEEQANAATLLEYDKYMELVEESLRKTNKHKTEQEEAYTEKEDAKLAKRMERLNEGLPVHRERFPKGHPMHGLSEAEVIAVHGDYVSEMYEGQGDADTVSSDPSAAAAVSVDPKVQWITAQAEKLAIIKARHERHEAEIEELKAKGTYDPEKDDYELEDETPILEEIDKYLGHGKNNITIPEAVAAFKEEFPEVMKGEHGEKIEDALDHVTLADLGFPEVDNPVEEAYGALAESSDDEFDLDETEQVREPSKQELAKFKKMDNEDESDDFDEIEKEV